MKLNDDDEATLLSRVDGEGASSWTDNDLFKQPLPNEECPICMLSLPLNHRESAYQSCCGKTLCDGCVYEFVKASKGDRDRLNCPFCRSPTPTSEGEILEMLKQHVEANDAFAIYSLGYEYNRGGDGFATESQQGP